MGLLHRFRRHLSRAGAARRRDRLAADGAARGDAGGHDAADGRDADAFDAADDFGGSPPFAALRALVDAGASTGDQRAEIARVLAAHGVPEPVVADYVGSMVDGVALRPSSAADGALRLGGPPVLPAGEAWPTALDGRPLGFVAALDLGAVPPSPPLPAAGVLLVFWDEAFDQPDHTDFVAATRVLLVPEGVEPQPADAPDGAGRFGPVSLAAARMSFPAAVDAGRLEDDDVPEGVPGYELEGALAEELGHRLLGAETPIQGPILDEVSYWFDHAAPATVDRYSAAEQAGEDWVFLAQIDEVDGLQFGDAGALYLVLPRTDLQAGRFDRVMGIMQCS